MALKGNILKITVDKMGKAWFRGDVIELHSSIWTCSRLGLSVTAIIVVAYLLLLAEGIPAGTDEYLVLSVHVLYSDLGEE